MVQTGTHKRAVLRESRRNTPGVSCKRGGELGHKPEADPQTALKDPTYRAEFRLCSVGIGKPMRLSYSTLKVKSASRNNERSSE